MAFIPLANWGSILRSAPALTAESLQRGITTGQVRIDTSGTAAKPALSINDEDSGQYWASANKLGWSVGGVEMFTVGVNRVAAFSKFLAMPVKTDAGDPTSPQNGDMYVNTADNKVRVYADAAWRDLATW